MKIVNFCVSGVAALALTGLASGASALTLYDNLSATNGGFASISSADNGPLADSFSTGATAVDLTDIKLLVGAANPNDGEGFFAAIFTDNSTGPDALLGVVGIVPNSSLTTSLTIVDLPQGPGELLQANTRYWVELIDPFAPTSSFWGYDSVNTGIGVANEYNYYAGSVSANSAFTPYQMQVNVAPVPEPMTWVMMLFGFFGLGAMSRSIRRKSIMDVATA